MDAYHRMARLGLVDDLSFRHHYAGRMPNFVHIRYYLRSLDRIVMSLLSCLARHDRKAEVLNR